MPARSVLMTGAYGRTREAPQLGAARAAASGGSFRRDVRGCSRRVHGVDKTRSGSICDAVGR